MSQMMRRGSGVVVVPDPVQDPRGGYDQRAAFRDTRNFGRGFDPTFPGDQWEQEKIRRSRVLRLTSGLVNGQTPTNQMQQAPFLASLTAANLPVQLLAKNSQRRSLIVFNPGPVPALPALNTIILSFGAPNKLGANAWLGIPLAPGGAAYAEVSGIISINDIWVVCNDPNGSFPFFVGCFEGTPSLFG